VQFRLQLGGAWTYKITVGKVLAGSGRLQAAVESRLPGADAFAICADAGSFWPTITVAVDFGSVWVACKERGELMRLDAARLRTTKVLRVGRSGLIAVATGLGSLWALDESFETLDRIGPAANAVTARIALGDGKPYNVWVGAAPSGSATTAAARSCRSTRRRTGSPRGSRSAMGRADLVFAR
jgi:hypothetical protein